MMIADMQPRRIIMQKSKPKIVKNGKSAKSAKGKRASTQIKDIMSPEPEVIPPDATLAEAAELMLALDTGYLPVGENDRLIGAITDRDIVIRAVAKGYDPEACTVEDIMTPRIQYCFEEDSVEDAASRMQEEQIRRLVVLDDEKRMVGVLSLGDIAKRHQNDNLTGETEQQIAEDDSPASA